MTELRSHPAAKFIALILLVFFIGLAAAAFFGCLFIEFIGGYDQYLPSYAESERGQTLARAARDYGDYYQNMYYFEKTSFNLLYTRANALPFIGGFSALLAIALFSFLVYAAGHKRGVEGIHLNALNRVPLDILAAADILLIFAITIFAMDMRYSMGWRLTIATVVLSAACVILLALLLILGFTTRLKAGGWWRNTLIYRCCRLIWRVGKRIFAAVARGIGCLIGNMPLLWKAIAAFIIFIIIDFFIALFVFWEPVLFFFLALPFNAAALAGLCYIILQLDRLKQGGIALAAGNLEQRVSTTRMRGEILRHAENLNNIGNAIGVVVEEKMKSERMKTELITNVSHDIKTPLTSIINYVDLLKKEDIPGESAREYLEVLDRQTQRLKKLTEDLVEASKASTGNIGVELALTNVGELLNQVVAEYGERLQAAKLTPVIDAPDKDTLIMADGRLLWRVFDNLLNNICKYSHPETRVYFSVRRRGERADITMKNISRELLNISADELMERFVRGDSARSSEGSGLGLSIARSLTELQQGTFMLDVDGDLVKSILCFAVVSKAEAENA